MVYIEVITYVCGQDLLIDLNSCFNGLFQNFPIYGESALIRLGDERHTEKDGRDNYRFLCNSFPLRCQGDMCNCHRMTVALPGFPAVHLADSERPKFMCLLQICKFDMCMALNSNAVDTWCLLHCLMKNVVSGVGYDARGEKIIIVGFFLLVFCAGCTQIVSYSSR